MKKSHGSTVILKNKELKKKKGFYLINAERVIELENHYISTPTVIKDSGKYHQQMLTTE